MTPKVPPGIEVRHRRACPAASGGACACEPSYRAWVFATRGKRKLQKSFRTLEDAIRWREDTKVDLRRGVLASSKPATVAEAAAVWLEGARPGTIRNRSGEVYKPSALRGYEQALAHYVLPELGRARLGDVRRADVQRLADDLLADGFSPSTVRNALMPLRAICRRALARGDLHVNPTLGLELPAQRGRRERVASPVEAHALISALPASDQPLWATAMYAGLRRGELRALRWSDIDLRRGVIRVVRSWDPVAGVIDPKSRAGKRVVPIAAVLRAELAPVAGAPTELAFGRAPDAPFDPSTVSDRAGRAWKAAGLQPITLHECRHTFASLMIAAGANPKAL